MIVFLSLFIGSLFAADLDGCDLPEYTLTILDDTVTHRLPALEYEFNRDLKRKADKEDMKE